MQSDKKKKNTRVGVIPKIRYKSCFDADQLKFSPGARTSYINNTRGNSRQDASAYYISV